MQAGQQLAGRFEILRRAGEGGMAEVYRARDALTGALVALKVLRAHAPDPEDLLRFEREAVTLAELRHPGIVRYVSHGRAEGRAYLAMEWVEGEVLADRLAAGRLPRAEAVALGVALADALGAAHRQGIVHRDVKPRNVILEGGDPGRARLLDFGVARLAHAATQLTQTGAMIGTAGYMPPEQARGGTIDGRTDVYALGCVLFRALSGRPVFEGSDGLSVLLKVVLERPPRLADVLPDTPAALDELLARMLDPDAARRPEDGAAVAAELRALVARGPAEAAPGGLQPPAPQQVALTALERRLTCVILARAAVFGRDEARLAAAIAPSGGHAEVLAGGAVAVTVGDAGTPIDQAAGAARCALALQAAFPGAPVALVAGWGDGRRAIDEAIDRGVPLLGAAVGAPRLDDVAAALLATRFDLSGDERGLTLRAERDVAAPERLLLGKPTPCVGRARELRMLEAIVDECVEEPAARVVLVTGETGVGKSRLRHELVRRVEGRGQPVEIWIGHGDPLGAGSPFGVLAPALRRAAGVAPGEALAVQRRKLRARVGRHVAAAEVDRVAEFLGELCGVPFDDAERVALAAARRDAQLLGDQMRRAFADLLAAELAAQPVLVVLEDLHWGDLPSVRLIDAALRNLSDRPLLVVALARPEVRAVFPELWAARAPTEIKLGPLLPRWSERLVRGAVGEDLDDATVARVVDLSAGNAFYLEELIRAVAAGRRDALPETVVAMAQAVLEGLDPESRRALRAASVFGRGFTAAGVAALSGLAAPEVEARLEELVEREIVVRRAADGDLFFRHAHVRESAYATLTDADRALGHRLAAVLLAGAGERDAARLAEHCERGGDLEGAVGHYRVAAEQALEANDLGRALTLAQRGVECGAEGEAFGALRRTAAEASRWLGQSREALLSALDAARELPRGGAAWLSALVEVAAAALKLGDAETVIHAGEEVTGTLGRADVASRVIACARIAAPLFLLGQRERATRLLGRAEALAAAAATTDPAVHARLLETRALAAVSGGGTAEFLALAAAAADAFSAVGDLRNAAVQRANLGSVHVGMGAYPEAERELGEVLATAERMGLPQIAAAARQSLALAVGRRGGPAARALAVVAVAEAEAQGNRRLEIGARVVLALVTGDPVEAAREAQAAAALAGGATPQRAYALAAAARASLALGRTEEALALAEEAAGVLEAVGSMDEGEALVRLVLAEARRAAGDDAGARAAIAAALRRLGEQAEKIDDPGLRRSFLERVPEHRQTRALAAALAAG
jgi:hypothetical protein